MILQSAVVNAGKQYLYTKSKGRTMRAFVTGSTGYVGSNLVKALSKLGWESYLYKRGEALEVVKDFDPEVIFHLAAELKDESKMVESNVVLTSDLLRESAEVYYQAFINIGSSSEYGMKDHPIVETDQLIPTTAYGATKAQATIYCQKYAIELRKPIITLRPFSVYGNNEKENRLLPTAIRCAFTGETLTLGEGAHDFVHVDDFVGAMIHFTEYAFPGDIVNIGTGRQTTNKEIVKLIEKISGRKIKVKPVKRFHEYDTDTWVADVTRAAKYQWYARIRLEEGIERMVNEYRKRQKNNH